ncbi:MAG: hypothetical protein IJ811_02965 [Clostridia bacterium]|nr:hypothetical protein [Clostridia bacterium]
MSENEKKYLAIVEEVDIDNEGVVMVPEGTDAAKQTVKIVYVDRYPTEQESKQPAPAEEEVAAYDATAEAQNEREEAEEDEEVVLDENGLVIRYRKSFTAKLIQTQNPNQDYYTEIKNYLLSYKGVKSRVSWNYDSFNKGRKKLVKMVIRGKTLVMYLALDPKDEQTFSPTKYFQFDASEYAKYAETPFGIKVKSDRGVKHAKELIDLLMASLGLTKGESIAQDYHKPYESTEQLIAEGLIKVVGGNNAPFEGSTEQGAFVEAQQKEQPITEEPTEQAEEQAEVEDTLPIEEPVKKERYVNKSFAQKMMASSEIIQDWYDDLKNYALRFKKLKSRISKKFDSINKGRLQFVKLSVAGKTLKLYLNMDIATTDPKFHCKDVSDKKTYEPVPVLIRIKSGRAVKYAKRLIDQCAEQHGLVENKKFIGVDAIALIEESLAK